MTTVSRSVTGPPESTTLQRSRKCNTSSFKHRSVSFWICFTLATGLGWTGLGWTGVEWGGVEWSAPDRKYFRVFIIIWCLYNILRHPTFEGGVMDGAGWSGVERVDGRASGWMGGCVDDRAFTLQGKRTLEIR